MDVAHPTQCQNFPNSPAPHFRALLAGSFRFWEAPPALLQSSPRRRRNCLDHRQLAAFPPGVQSSLPAASRHPRLNRQRLLLRRLSRGYLPALLAASGNLDPPSLDTLASRHPFRDSSCELLDRRRNLSVRQLTPDELAIDLALLPHYQNLERIRDHFASPASFSRRWLRRGLEIRSDQQNVSSLSV